MNHRTATLALLMTLAGLAPARGAAPAIPQPRPLRTVLGNGLVVLTVPKPGVPLVTLHLVLSGTGSDAEPPDQPGLAAAAADMLDESAGERDALGVARELEHLGATLHISTNRSATTLTLEVPSHGLDDALALLADIVERPRYLAQDWRRIQESRAERLEQATTRVDDLVERAVDHLLDTGGSWAQTRPRSVMALELEQLRSFHAAHVRPNRATLIIVGVLDPLALTPRLARTLGGWSPGPRPHPLPRSRRPADGPRVLLVERSGAATTGLRLVARPVAPGELSDTTRAALELLRRLLLSAAERRLGPEARAGLIARAPGFRAGGALILGATVDAPMAATTLVELRRACEALVTTAPSENELQDARTDWFAGEARARHTTRGLAAFLAETERDGEARKAAARYARALERITPAQLRRVARQFLAPATLTVLLAGDRAVAETALAVAGFGAPVIADDAGTVSSR